MAKDDSAVTDFTPEDDPVPVPDPPKPLDPGTVGVRVRWPQRTFDTRVGGVPVLTNDFQPIAQDQLSHVLDAARRSRITIETEQA